MTPAVVVALVSAAALYRVVFSLSRPPTVWRTALTACIVGAAAGAALIFYGHRLDRLLGVPNLAKLLVHLVLAGTAAATMVYVAASRGLSRQARVLRGVAVATAGVGVIQVVTWVLAPLHQRPLGDIVEVMPHPAAVVFEGSFVAAMLPASVVTAWFCATRALSRHDLTRTISLALTGSACAGASLVFVLYAVAIVLLVTDRDRGVQLAVFSDRLPPVVVAVLGLGTLSLLLVPVAVRLAAAHRRWRGLRPLWRELVRRHPEVHLGVGAAGTPLRRLQQRVERAVVESHDALRLVRVPLSPGADLAELGRALREDPRPDGCPASAVLAGAAPPPHGDRLLAVATAYARARPPRTPRRPPSAPGERPSSAARAQQ